MKGKQKGRLTIRQLTLHFEVTDFGSLVLPIEPRAQIKPCVQCVASKDRGLEYGGECERIHSPSWQCQ